jgi:hypothetical protein
MKGKTKMLNHPIAWHRHHSRRRTMRLEAFLAALPDAALVALTTASVILWMLGVAT